MGGGDLNMKKSWHPHTLHNIERVWKAEQKAQTEKRQIEQLQKELAEERARDEIRKMASDTGYRKQQDRLDWMYQGAMNSADKDAYLLGKPVDRTVLRQPKKDDDDLQATNVPSKVTDMGAAGDMRDMTRKVREDPMFMIKKREQDHLRAIRHNPLRMEALRQVVEDKTKKKKKKKSKDKKERAEEEEEEEGEAGEAGSEERERERDGGGAAAAAAASHSHSHSHSRGDHDHDEERGDRHRDRADRHQERREDRGDRRHDGDRERERARQHERPRDEHSRDEHSRDEHPRDRHRVDDRPRRPDRDDRDRDRDRDRERDRERERERDRQRRDEPRGHYNGNGRGAASHSRAEEDEAERQRKLDEMMANAKWREEDRKKQVAEAEAAAVTDRVEDSQRNDDAFAQALSKQAMSGAATTSLEDRLRRNVHYIQRTNHSMETGGLTRR